jgi:transcriptional regulator with XRE-family HTH domain
MRPVKEVDGVGARVRAARLKRTWAIGTLARRADLNFTHVSRIESGHRPSLDTFVRLAKALEISADELLDLQQPREPIYAKTKDQ